MQLCVSIRKLTARSLQLLFVLCLCAVAVSLRLLNSHVGYDVVHPANRVNIHCAGLTDVIVCVRPPVKVDENFSVLIYISCKQCDYELAKKYIQGVTSVQKRRSMISLPSRPGQQTAPSSLTHCGHTHQTGSFAIPRLHSHSLHPFRRLCDPRILKRVQRD